VTKLFLSLQDKFAKETEIVKIFMQRMMRGGGYTLDI